MVYNLVKNLMYVIKSSSLNKILMKLKTVHCRFYKQFYNFKLNNFFNFYKVEVIFKTSM